MSNKGFTLMELMIVIAILVLVMAAGWTNWLAQITKAYDARRKSDLVKLKTMLEDYYNSHGCFPTQDVWNHTGCGSGDFEKNGLSGFLCDPETNLHYRYEPIGPASCDGYRIYATLVNKNDADISAVGCTAAPVAACGSMIGVNYGVTSGVSLVN